MEEEKKVTNISIGCEEMRGYRIFLNEIIFDDLWDAIMNKYNDKLTRITLRTYDDDVILDMECTLLKSSILTHPYKTHKSKFHTLYRNFFSFDTHTCDNGEIFLIDKNQYQEQIKNIVMDVAQCVLTQYLSIFNLDDKGDGPFKEESYSMSPLDKLYNKNVNGLPIVYHIDVKLVKISPAIHNIIIAAQFPQNRETCTNFKK